MRLNANDQPFLLVEDDGQAAHLEGSRLPDIPLMSTCGNGAIIPVNLASLPRVIVVIAFSCQGVRPSGVAVNPQDIEEARAANAYDPRLGSGGSVHQWSSVLRARHVLAGAGASEILGLSVDRLEVLQAAQQQLQLPFRLLSDSECQLTQQMGLPMTVLGQ
jgi:AhpC/TSA family